MESTFPASGLVLLTLAVLGAGGPQPPRLALGLFVVAALGGFVLFSFHLRKNWRSSWCMRSLRIAADHRWRLCVPLPSAP